MNKNRGLVIAALIVAIIGLSIGFAAFSNTLNISSSATVNPSDENFIVQFSKYSDSDATGESNPITPTALTSDYGENGLIPDSNKKALQNLHATFTAPGQSVTYELYVRNTGAYVAYLKELAFANATNATGSETYKHCYAATTDSNNQPISSENQATASLVSSACNGISISVSIGTASNITPDSPSKSLGNQALQANGGYVQARVTITYANNAAYVDGPMEVEFGTISFTASSNQGSSQGSQEQSGGQETPTSNTVTLSLSQIGQSMDCSGGPCSFKLDDFVEAGLLSSIKNNSTELVTGNGYFNSISSSDNTLTNLSSMTLASENDVNNLFSNDNFYWVQWFEDKGVSFAQLTIKKDGIILSSENYTSDDFKDITFTITGTDN